MYGSPDVVYVDAIANVKQLKVQLENDIEGNPKPEGQTLIWRGRRLKDDEVVGKLIAELEGPEVSSRGRRGTASGVRRPTVNGIAHTTPHFTNTTCAGI